MTSITGIAKKFFEACETGKGWAGCKAYCKTDATMMKIWHAGLAMKEYGWI
jgi:hypothetical protein